MTYKYGTAGFRFNANELIKISQKIAIGCVHILSTHSIHNNFLAIMITASHNPKCDNGVKIIDNKGCMIPQEDEKLLEDFVNGSYEYINNIITQLKENPPKITILFGYDTRPSCPHILTELIKGFELVSTPTFINSHKVSTPLLHHIAFNQGDLTSINQYIETLDEIKLKFNPFVDCAGGVGACVLQKLGHGDLKVGCFPENTELNVDCGSEHILSSASPPKKWKINPGEYGCSLDGDADRLVFWYLNHKKQFHILDGDNQMALWAFFLKSKFPSVIAVSTPYCNGATIDFLKEHNIDVKLTPTGIKNLHHEAQKYPVAVYFENNGHGTAHWPGNIVLKNGQILAKNELIGDGIYNIFTTFQILEELEMTMNDWVNMYKKKNTYQYKIPISSVPDLQIKGVQCDIVEPEWLKEYVERKSRKHNARIFMRPSGTEPIIRVYMEADNIPKLRKSFCKKIK